MKDPDKVHDFKMMIRISSGSAFYFVKTLMETGACNAFHILIFKAIRENIHALLLLGLFFFIQCYVAGVHSFSQFTLATNAKFQHL